MSLTPTIGESGWLTEKNKLSVRKKILLEPVLQKNIFGEGKNSKLIMVCTGYERKLLVEKETDVVSCSAA